MYPILNGTGILSDLDAAGELAIWPEGDFSDPEIFAHPLVVLLHGMGPFRSVGDMTSPTNQTSLLPFDPEWRPQEKDEGWHYFPPNLILDKLQFIVEFIADPSAINLLQAILTLDLELSPEVEGDRSWFTHFRNKNYPVLAYTVAGSLDPIDAPGGAYDQFRQVMLDVHRNLLVDGKQGLAGCKRIAFVGHSRGGLMARRYIVDALSGRLAAEGEHEDIVKQRVRFLGTLNSPHLGSSLAIAPAFLNEIASIAQTVPGVGDIVQQVYDVVDGSVSAAAELNPLASQIVNLLASDLTMLEQDWRMQRIDRASTGSSAPVIRRMWTYIYNPTSFVPTRIQPPNFRHTLLPVEVPLSPILEAVGENDPSIWEASEAAGFTYLRVPEELRAQGRDLVNPTIVYESGGDALVTNTSARVPGAGPPWMSPIPGVAAPRHRTFEHHHGAPLWHEAYKIFIGAPKGPCYPPLEFLLGDNVVEISWSAFPDPFNPYKVWRFHAGNAEMRGATAGTLYYDPVATIGALKYLVTYPTIDGSWVPPDESESDLAGNLPVTISTIRRAAELDSSLQALPARVAASPVSGTYVIFLPAYDALLSETLSPNLGPTRERLVAFTDELRVSEPYSIHEQGDTCLTAWLTFAHPAQEVTLPGLPGGDDGTVEGGSSDSNVGGMTVLVPDPNKIVFRLYAADVANNGTIPNPSMVLEGQAEASSAQQQIIASLSETVDSPRMLLLDDTRLFAFTAGSSYDLYLAETDLELTQVGDLISVQLVQPPLAGSANDPQGPDPLVLYDFFYFSEIRWVALVGRAPSTLFVVTGDGNQVSAISQITNVPWLMTGCLGGALGGTLLLFLSSSANQVPVFGTVEIAADGSLAGNPDWNHPYLLPELPGENTFTCQDVVLRCPTWIDVLVSATGFFKDDSVSSSLYRVRFSNNGAEDAIPIHHSAFGHYDVTIARSEQSLSNSATVWQRYEPSPFEPGLYGQLVPVASSCTQIEDETPGIEWGGMFGPVPIEVVIEKLRKFGVAWTDRLADVLSDMSWIRGLLRYDRLRNSTLTLLERLHSASMVDSKRADASDLTRDRRWVRVKRQVRIWLDVMDQESVNDDNTLVRLKESLDWVPPIERAHKLLKNLERKKSAPQGARVISKRSE